MFMEFRKILFVHLCHVILFLPCYSFFLFWLLKFSKMNILFICSLPLYGYIPIFFRSFSFLILLLYFFSCFLSDFLYFFHSFIFLSFFLSFFLSLSVCFFVVVFVVVVVVVVMLDIIVVFIVGIVSSHL